jgi:metal-responsive CopG/Arc/MetJ family transcriptional regulator
VNRQTEKEGENMAANLRRFTVSINQDMEVDLDKAKKEAYYKETQSEMIRDLINRGLASLKEAGDSNHNKAYK